MDERSRAIYRLLRVPGIGPGAVARVLAAWQQEPELLGGFWGRPIQEYCRRWGLGTRSARELRDAADDGAAWAAAEGDVGTARAARIEMMTILDGDYAALAAARGLPAVLFTRGNQDLIRDEGVALVHSRGASEEALEWGGRVAAALAESGRGLITGHNRDGYQRSAIAAKRAGTPSVIVLDRPLHDAPASGPRSVPVATARLWDTRFHPDRELMVSDAGPREVWTPAHARRRDRLIIGLAGRVVAGAVREGGIIAGLCQQAMRDGRPVFRSPFCRVELEAPVLPLEVEAACEAIIRTGGDQDASIDASPSPRRSGWLERQWDAEAAAFVAEVVEITGTGGWAQRQATSVPFGVGTLPGEPAALIYLPSRRAGDRAEVVAAGWPGAGAHWGSGGGDRVLVLTPATPHADLETLREYLARCRSRLREAVSSPPPPSWPARGPEPTSDSRPSPE